MASSSTDPDDATAALIAQMVAADLDAEDAAQSYHGNYSDPYNGYYDDHGDDDYGSHTDIPYEAEQESAPIHPANGAWEHYNNSEDPAFATDLVSSIPQGPDGTWDASEAPLPVKRSKKKQAAAENGQHEGRAQTDEPPTASGSNPTSIEDADEQPTPIPKPLTINRVAISHEELDAYSPQNPTSNAPGKRRAASPPAYRLPHRPYPSTHSHPQPPPPSPPRQTTSPNPNSREIDITVPSDGWGVPAPGTEDWDLLEIKIPWPGSERGYGASRVAEMEAEMRRREDAAVVEVRVGEGEDLWSLLGELCLEEEEGRGEGEGDGVDEFEGLRRWGTEGWRVGVGVVR